MQTIEIVGPGLYRQAKPEQSIWETPRPFFASVAYRFGAGRTSMIPLTGTTSMRARRGRPLPPIRRIIGSNARRAYRCVPSLNKVCYDKANSYMLILLNSTWYHYCEIDSGTVAALIGAESVGRFFNANIKGTGKDGPFDCRSHRVPNY
jgi:hypothetical protein